MGIIIRTTSSALSLMLLMLISVPGQAEVDVTFTLPQRDLQAREVFEVPIYLTDGAVNVTSYALRIHYSPELVKIIEITGGNFAGFTRNPTTDRNRFDSGVIDFTANNQGFLDTPDMYEVARVRFEVIGFPGAQGEIGVELSPNGGIVNKSDFSLEAVNLSPVGNIAIDDQGRINQAPVANAGADISLTLGEMASMSGEGSHDPDNYPAPLSYQWSVTGVPTGSGMTNSDIVNAGQAVAQLTPDMAGQYTVQIRVSDGVDANVDEAIITAVANNLPGTPANVMARAKRRHVNVVWDAVNHSTGYIVYRQLDTETEFDVIGMSQNTVYVDNIPGRSQSAEYYVVAENENGESAPSDTVQVTVTSGPRSRR